MASGALVLFTSFLHTELLMVRDGRSISTPGLQLRQTSLGPVYIPISVEQFVGLAWSDGKTRLSIIHLI